MTTIRDIKRNLHLLKYSDVNILYDTNRVRTYGCSDVEAALMNGNGSKATKFNKHPRLFHKQEVETADFEGEESRSVKTSYTVDRSRVEIIQGLCG